MVAACLRESMNNNNNIKLPPITNKPLKDAMLKLKHGGEQEFIQELLKARLLCPAMIEGMNTPPVPDADGKVKLEGKLKLFVLNAKDGKSYLMAFTDMEELKKWRVQEKEQVVIWGLPQYTGVLTKEDCPHEGFVINPFGENVIVHREYLKKMKNNIMQLSKPFVFGAPKEEELMEDDGTFPAGMIQALRDYMEQSGDVIKAYLLDMVKEDEQDYLMVVQTTENPKYLFPCINNAAEPYLGDKKLNIVPYGTELANAVIQGKKPIFIKKR